MRRLIFVLLLSVTLSSFAAERAPKVDHLIYITLDGFRWQEFFGGAQDELLNRQSGGVLNVAELQKRHSGTTPHERRENLLPFIWGTIAKKGQIFGDPEKKSRAHVTNGLKFSYPGYNEMLSGVADSRIDSNAKKPNPNVTVLEWLNQKADYKGRVSAIGGWDVLPFIVNEERSGLHVSVGKPPFQKPANENQNRINAFAKVLPSYWHDFVFDSVTIQVALETLRTDKPRVLYVMLGETDEWGHGRRYDLYLDAARHGDDFIRQVWELVQSDPEYKDRTALVISTDHGRGKLPANWTSHNKDTEGAEEIWIAALGPQIAPLGIRENVTVTQAQIAATLAALLGENFKADVPAAAEPLPFK